MCAQILNNYGWLTKQEKVGWLFNDHPMLLSHLVELYTAY